ncbi:GFA family protein [Sphingomonas dokdonensis]|uniref:Glutathione-dependent formaldehyde-activating enzyme n=1 Tax=Sphingomonas dokdonensis TaxID=344880 RepID=A0A245ZUE5_9SPHN|nr:GFA family protein [Sphingomonas dokdonensis]OWK33365.1 glutathione-dependent formaldehyde-activating enzyme [Sphingomonas dokdonensis]
MATTGKCHCGAISWSADGPPEHHAVCHCSDCRRWSGAPMVGWIAWRADRVTINGATARYHSSQHGTREFCGACGTGLFYRNPEVLPGIIDIQSGTLDDPESQPPGAQIMVKERLGWAPGIADLPAFQTYPGVD